MTSTDKQQPRIGLRRVACQRTQAAMLSVALAISAISPATGLATTLESDREQEGASAPEPDVPDRSSDPGFDPGGETQLPFRIGAPTGGGDDDTGDGPPVDVEPLADPDALAVEPDDPTVVTPNALEDTVEPAAPADPAPSPTPTITPAPATRPPAAVPVPNADKPPVADEHRARAERPTARERDRDRQTQRPIATVPLPDPAVAPAPAPATPTPPPTVAPVATTERPRSVRPEADAHVVQRGESLWTVASDLLGQGASDAEIAAESDRLYSLNRDRIGPDPDLLLVGTVLRLR